MSRTVDPEEIERQSFEIIERELGTHAFGPREFRVVQRAIHASGDFDFARNLVFHPAAIEAGLAALRAGRDVVVDVEMVKVGVSRSILQKLGGDVRCFISDPDVIARAREEGVTRAIVAMRKAAAECPDALVAVGNAPTALLEMIDLARRRAAAPALVVGAPVGFVAAAESKEALIESGLPFIACRGRKGGSSVAVAIVNALLRLADER